MKTRLPPQPNNSKLAKLVQRLVDNIPVMSYRKKREYDNRVSNLQFELHMRLDQIISLQDDYEMLFDRPRSPRYSVSIDERDQIYDSSKIVSTRVEFEPIQMNYMLSTSKPFEIHDITRLCMIDTAKRIAEEYTHKMEDAIIKMAEEKYKISIK